ncbi:MAG TPA: histidine phosphatase family protein [Acidimicrobiales bacterium]|nr:histidine phosphatase family protein [Acidimicrobiales bacterium]
MPARLVVVRHGATAWSTAGRHTGTTDLPLEPEGRAQAEALALRLAGHAYAEVLTSPLRRAADTCALAGFGTRAVVEEGLREWDYGDYEGRTTDEVRAGRPGWTIWRDGVPGGETLQEVAARADEVIARVRASGGDTLAFAHAHILRVLAARWLGLEASAGAHLVLGPAAPCVLGWERETPALVRWNDTGSGPVP